MLKGPFGADALGVQDRVRPLRDPSNSEEAHPLMAHGGPVVDDRPTGPVFQVALDPGDPVLEFQRRGDAVHRLVAVRFGRLPVGVKVDESRADHLAGRIEEHPALLQPVLERLAGNGRDLVPRDSDLASRIQPGLGIENPAAGNHEIEVPLLSRQRRGEQQNEEQGAGTEPETRGQGPGHPCRNHLEGYLGITGSTTLEGWSASW